MALGNRAQRQEREDGEEGQDGERGEGRALHFQPWRNCLASTPTCGVFVVGGLWFTQDLFAIRTWQIRTTYDYGKNGQRGSSYVSHMVLLLTYVLASAQSPNHVHVLRNAAIM